ncbi:MAG: hypothetical protein ACK5WB_14455 [Phycisphaerales bacterium]
MMADQMTKSAPEHSPLKQKLIALLISAVLLGLGGMMIYAPSASIAPTEDSTRRTSLIIKVMDLIWSMPTGIILALLGLMLLIGIFTKKEEIASAQSAESKAN